jgi:hypothetical protein
VRIGHKDPSFRPRFAIRRKGEAMSQRGVERTLGRLVTDQGFRQVFFEDPAAASLRIGADLTRDEIDALLRVPLAALSEFSVRLDDRICRLHIRQEPMQQESRP